MLRFKTRRLMLARLKRIYKHEFWSYKILYAPLFFYIVYRCAKAKNATLFTAVNPGMPMSGIKNESKTDIYLKLSPSYVIPFLSIDANQSVDDNVAAVRQFMSAHQTAYPVILKPDTGERGDNVHIVANETDLRRCLRSDIPNWIAQKYIPGKEFGVFYIRYPSRKNGFIFSVSEKEMLFVTGDGMHTLGELILMHPRAMLLAHIHLRKWAHASDSVPKNGESVQIVHIGSHSKGSVFVDRSELVTRKMEAAFDRISKTYDGFYFGRFDVRVPTEADLTAGRSIHILELNGLTGEPANMYTPHYSLFKTYAILFTCWRHALNIAEENQRRNPQKYTLAEVWKSIQ